jgi:hypothetical protein
MSSIQPTAPIKAEKRANHRLSVDLARFRQALDQIEGQRRDGECTGIAMDQPSPEDVRRYLDCIDECFGRFGAQGPNAPAQDDLVGRRSKTSG